jgi:hypothetical protein
MAAIQKKKEDGELPVADGERKRKSRFDQAPAESCMHMSMSSLANIG